MKVLDHPPAILKLLSVFILLHVNLYSFKQRFKCEDLSVEEYYHLEIFPDHRKFLAFPWDFGHGVLKYFQFVVLSFGLSSAPNLFTKLFKPAATSWRCKGIPMVIFLNNGLGGDANRIQGKINGLTVRFAQISFRFFIILLTQKGLKATCNTYG